jgi:hypothetical protein
MTVEEMIKEVDELKEELVIINKDAEQAGIHFGHNQIISDRPYN